LSLDFFLEEKEKGKNKIKLCFCPAVVAVSAQRPKRQIEAI